MQSNTPFLIPPSTHRSSLLQPEAPPQWYTARNRYSWGPPDGARLVHLSLAPEQIVTYGELRNPSYKKSDTV